MNDFVKYGEVIVEIYPTKTGFGFKCPLDNCEWETQVEGDIGHCKNRIHQHLYLEHKYGPHDILDWPPAEVTDGLL